MKARFRIAAVGIAVFSAAIGWAQQTAVKRMLVLKSSVNLR